MAQSGAGTQVGSLLRQADSAYAAGEQDRAKRLYHAVLSVDRNNSRATFRLGQLSPPGSPDAVSFHRRYVALEPQDPWGYMALGDALARAGATAEAVAQYAAARRRAPGEPDVYVGLGRILRASGRTDDLIENYEEWVRRRPGDRQAWIELAEARRRARRYPEAADAYARALALKPEERTTRRLEGVLAETAFSLRPYAGQSVDSDDNKVLRLGVEGNWQLSDRARGGIHLERADVSDPSVSRTVDEVGTIASWQPLAALRTDGLLGVAWLDSNQGGQTRHALARLHLRWSIPQEGPRLDLRLIRNPLIATPGLVADPVELQEVRGGADLPLGGPFRAVARGQLGKLSSSSDVNHRSGYQLGPAYRWGPAAEIGFSYRTLGYDHDAGAGYFAPRRVEAVELGTYFEKELWPVSFALDAGAGEQRVAKQGEAFGAWVAAFRAWASISWELSPGARLGLELEHEDSPVGGAAATPTSDWRSNSVLLSLRFGVNARSARSFLRARTDGGR